MRQLFYYKIQYKFIRKCFKFCIKKYDSFISKCVNFIMRQLLQYVSLITKCIGTSYLNNSEKKSLIFNWIKKAQLVWIFCLMINKLQSVVACTCNLTTTEAEFWNGVSSIPLEVTGPR